MPLPPGFLPPCLPTKAPQPPTGDAWLHEIKHDGFHVVARKEASGPVPMRRDAPVRLDRLHNGIQKSSGDIGNDETHCDLAKQLLQQIAFASYRDGVA
jgi:hypothetical protein